MLDNAFARRGFLALWDVGSWALATAVVIGVRHDFNLSEVLWESVIVYWLLASALLVGLGYATKFYRGRYLVGSFDEAFGLAVHLAAVGAATLALSAMMTTARAPQHRGARATDGAADLRRRATVLPRAARPAPRRRVPPRRVAGS